MRRWTVGAFGLWMTACPGDDAVSGGTTEGTDGTTGGSMSTSTTSSSTASTMSTGSETGTTTSSESSGETTAIGSESTSLEGSDSGSTMAITDTGSTGIDPSATSVITGTGEDTGGLLGNGETCQDNTECASGNCYVLGVLGGVCGECLVDDDCVYGCGLPNPLAMPPTGSTCDDGGLAAGCETSEACQMGLVCAEIVDVPGIATMNGCSECDSDDDCAELCSPSYASVFTEFEGHWECVTIGSQPLGASCDFDGTGNQACDSGFCVPADIMGIVLLGVCSECAIDDDCGAGTCSAPTIDLDGTMTAGMCG